MGSFLVRAAAGTALLLAAGVCCPAAPPCCVLDAKELERAFGEAVAGFDGRVGVCAADRGAVACHNPDERFSLQSVMKLPVGMAVLDAVDRGTLTLETPVIVRREDLSLYVQPLSRLVTAEGYRTTIGDLVRRAIIDSDSAATDILIARLGGTSAVNSFLNAHGIRGVRVDRDERHLQTEIKSLQWKPEFVDPAALDAAIAAVPEARLDEGYRRYQTDVRDSATPRGMTKLLGELAAGRLLSASSTAFLLKAMTETATFPDRLKAGTPEGWTIMHKTGTSGSWKGVTAATNDVGILRAPDGVNIAISVFIGDSRAGAAHRAKLMATLASLTASHRSLVKRSN